MKQLRAFLSGLLHTPSKLLFLLVIVQLIQGFVIGANSFKEGNIGVWALIVFLTVIVVSCARVIYKAIEGINSTKEFDQ